MEKELKIVKKEKDEAQNKLTAANELLAANERELKNVVHATLCANPPEAAVVEGASTFMKSLSKFVHELKNLGCANHDISNLYLEPAVAKLIPKGLKVEEVALRTVLPKAEVIKIGACALQACAMKMRAFQVREPMPNQSRQQHLQA